MLQQSQQNITIIIITTIIITKNSWTSKVKDKQPPMDNSLEILQGSADTITKQYEVLSDLIK